MPTDIQHFEQINRSKKLLQCESLEPQTATYLEWTVVIIFYSAVHIIEWYFAQQYNGHSKNHDDRKLRMDKFANLKRIKPKFDYLLAESKKARYNCARYNKDDIPKYLQYLNEIEKAVGL